MTPDPHALRRLIVATLNEGGMRSDTRYDPERMAVLLIQRMECSGFIETRKEDA